MEGKGGCWQSRPSTLDPYALVAVPAPPSPLPLGSLVCMCICPGTLDLYSPLKVPPQPSPLPLGSLPLFL